MALSVNRETKIGLAVLLGLSIVFAGLLAWRLTQSTEAVAVPPAPEKDEAAAKAVGQRPQQDAQVQMCMAAKPALLSPAGPPSPAPKPALDDTASWSAEGDARTPRPDGSQGRAAEGSASLLAGAHLLAVGPTDGYATASDPPPAPAADRADRTPAAAIAESEQRSGGRRAPHPPAAASTAGSGPAASPRREKGSYEVQANDSYWTISEKVYGTADYFRALAEHNRGKSPQADGLSPGMVVSVPTVTQLEHDYPDLCPMPSKDSPEPAERTAQQPQSGYQR
jgi:hypothetical protein